MGKWASLKGLSLKSLTNPKGYYGKYHWEFEQKIKEQQERVKKERIREEEEYTYNLLLKRKKDNDIYEARKAALEKELSERKGLNISISSASLFRNFVLCPA